MQIGAASAEEKQGEEEQEERTPWHGVREGEGGDERSGSHKKVGSEQAGISEQGKCAEWREHIVR